MALSWIKSEEAQNKQIRSNSDTAHVRKTLSPLTVDSTEVYSVLSVYKGNFSLSTTFLYLVCFFMSNAVVELQFLILNLSLYCHCPLCCLILWMSLLLK